MRPAVTGRTSNAIRSSDQRTDARNRREVTVTRLGHELREDGRVDGLGEDGVRGQEEHPSHLVGHHPTLHRAACHDGATEQQPRAGVEHDPPPRVSEHRHHPIVAPTPAGSEPEARDPAGDEQRADEGHDPAGASRHEEPALARREVEPRVGTRHAPEHDQAGDHHDGVADGGGRGDGEAPTGVEHGGGDRAGGVEHDLRDEEAQQVGHELALVRGPRLGHAQCQRPGQERCADDPQRAPRCRGPREPPRARHRPPPRPRPDRRRRAGRRTPARAPPTRRPRPAARRGCWRRRWPIGRRCPGRWCPAQPPRRAPARSRRLATRRRWRPCRPRSAGRARGVRHVSGSGPGSSLAAPGPTP